jgi:hypothetical protein
MVQCFFCNPQKRLFGYFRGFVDRAARCPQMPSAAEICAYAYRVDLSSVRTDIFELPPSVSVIEIAILRLRAASAVMKHCRGRRCRSRFLNIFLQDYRYGYGPVREKFERIEDMPLDLEPRVRLDFKYVAVDFGRRYAGLVTQCRNLRHFGVVFANLKHPVSVAIAR